MPCQQAGGAYPAVAQGTSIFNVGSASAQAALATSAGSIPSGSALVTDPGSPQGQYTFGGPGTQQYTTKLACEAGTSDSGAVSSAATLTASNGQQISSGAGVRKQCYDLQVSVATKAAPRIGRWGWTVTKTASPPTLTLRPEGKAYAGSSSPLGAFGGAPTTGDVTYTVKLVRSAPAGLAEGAAAFEAHGEVTVHNPAPINARLQGVYVSLSNSRGGQPFVAQAACPVLVIPAGQSVACEWRASPSFNPVGEQVRATARYINTHNGEAQGATTDFSSAPVTVGGGAAAAAGSRRRLQQTWGANGAGAQRGAAGADFLPSLAATVYGINGAPMIVPSAVAANEGVIVSGQSVLGGAGAAPAPIAMSAAGGVPVILPSKPRAGNHGAFVNEAGPGGVAAALGDQLSGLQDECVTVSDTFLTDKDPSSVAGKLVAGTPPSGRVCATTTFTYTVRYGPYSDCSARTSFNEVTFAGADTRARGASRADVAVRVEGCANPTALRIAPVKTLASARGGYVWTASTRADKGELVLGRDATATVTYTVDVKRSAAKSGASFTAEVAVTNPTASAVPIEAVSYSAKTMCDGAAKTTTGPVACDAMTVPAHGRVTCTLAGALPCASNGAYSLVLTAGGGFTVTSQPTPFAFNAQALAEQGSGSACVTVVNGFKGGAELVRGTFTGGRMPSGKVCDDASFTYTAKFGPFPKCGSFQVRWRLPSPQVADGWLWVHLHAAKKDCLMILHSIALSHPSTLINSLLTAPPLTNKKLPLKKRGRRSTASRSRRRPPRRA